MSGGHGKGAMLPGDRAGVPAVGAGDLRGQAGGAALQQSGEGALGQAGGRGGGQVLHGLEVEGVHVGLVQGAAGNNFAPLDSESTDFTDLVGVELAACHV